MPVANPYFIKLELVWPDGRPANQNEIARVKAFDNNAGVITEQGQSGYNPATGGWFPVYMQNIAGFYPPREKPNLYFQVESVQEQVVHTTQVFSNIPSGSTVRITIGVGAVLVGGGGGGPTTYQLSGTLTVEGNGPLTSGTVTAYDLTNGSLKGLGSTSPASDGTYLITFLNTDFENNGGFHASPNLMIQVFSSEGTPIASSSVLTAAPNPAVIDLVVPDTSAEEPSTQRRIHGQISNTLGLPVSGIMVKAYHLAWTVEGLMEIELTASVLSDSGGDYEILYAAPVVVTPPNPCAGASDAVNVIVYAQRMEGSTLVTLQNSGVIPNAPADLLVNLTVDEVSNSTDSEYRELDEAVGHCLGEDDEARFTALNQLNSRRDYLAFIAQQTGFAEELVVAYVRAWLIAGEINAKVPASALSTPMDPEPMYALVRGGRGQSLSDLLDMLPDEFFTAMMEGIAKGFVSSELEAVLPQLLADWRVVLSKLMLAGTQDTWQSDLIDLVVPGGISSFPQVQTPVGTYANSGSVSTHTVPLPASVTAGDLLFVALTTDYHADIAVPSGWSRIWNDTITGEIRFGGYVKVADGSESGGNVVFTVSGTEPGAAQVFRVAAGDWYGDLSGVEASVVNKANSTNITLPALAPSWGNAKTLWFAAAAHEEDNALDSVPSSFGDLERTPSGAGTGNVTVLTARQELEVASMSPGSFVIVGANNWISVTVAIRPADAENAAQEAVVGAHFDSAGDFERMLDALVNDGSLTQDQADDLLFVVELYQRVDQYYPIVAVLYNDKAGRGWKTVDDLASVKLRSGSSGSGWEYYASAQQSYSNGAFPGDIPGKNASEKIEIYAQRLYDKFGGAAAQTRFVSAAAEIIDGTEPPGFADAIAFLSDHPDFDLSATPIDKYLADEGITLTDEVVAQLKQLQRVYRVSPDFDVALTLVTEGLDSAVKIAQHDEDQFVADFEEKLGGLTVARSVHRKAKHYSGEIFATLVRFNQTVNDAGGSPMLPATVNLASATTQSQGAGQKYPNWVTLFGNLNSCASRHCQTVLSPGAYLVDLLSFVSGAPKNVLLARRPDLAEIELTCANTDRVVPYIDLVNEVLEAVIAPHEVVVNDGVNLSTTDLVDAVTGAAARDRVLSVLRTAGYIFTERALVKLSALDDPADASAREFVVEDDSWRFVIRLGAPPNLPYVAYGAPQTSETGRLLDVFPEHYNPAAIAELEQTVFPFQLPLAMGREETSLILERRKTAHHELLEAFQASLSMSEILSDLALARAFLNLTASEESAILSSSLDVREYWGFDSDSVSVPRPEDSSEMVSGAWQDVMSHMSIFMHRAQLSYQDVLELVDTRFVHDTSPIEIVGGGTPEEAAKNTLECNYNRFRLDNLTSAALQKISFFLRLRRKLGWDIVTTDRVLSRVLGGTIPADLVETSSFVRLQNQLKLKPAQLTGFWLDLDTRRTDRHTRSVFDEVYLKGDPSSPEYRALDALSRGESDISVSPAPGGSGVLQLDAFKTYLRGALGLSAQDMDELWLAIVLDPSDPQVVGLGELSAMNAVASFCRALKLSVRDFYQAKTLLGADPFPTPGTVDIEATYAALVELRRWRQSGVRLSELAYLLLGVSPSGEDLSPTLEDLEQVHRQFAVRGGEIVARYPDVSAPDAQTMQAHLEEVMPADKAGTATSILETPTASATDEPFLVRYFEAFWPTVATDITAVLALTDAEDRYAEVYRRLRPHLVARARRQAALQVAAESTNAAADVVDQLLTASLTSVAGGSPIPAAIEDWGLGLLGWDDGSETIVDASSTPATRSSRWVVPEDGEYRFIIREAGDTAGATLVLGGDELTLESSVGGESVFGPVTQRAGDVLPIRLDYSGVGSISLLVRRDNGDPEVLPASQLSPFDEQAFVKLDKAVRLARGLSLANSELDYVNFKDATLFDDLNGGGVTWSRLGWLVDQLQLNRRVRLDRTTLFELVREPMPPATDPDPVEDLARIEALTGWKQEDLTAILAITPWDSPPPLLRNIETWFVLERCMALVGKLDLRASQILDLLVTNAPSVSAALTLRDSLRSSFSEDSWRDTFKPLRDKLRQRERDALVGYLTTRPVDIGGVDHYFTDANDLFSYFLIDVEMEPDTQLSRIKLALNAIQLFVQRVFLGLEPERALRQLEKKQEQWKWMSAYRVWEANRKVFLFPENWVEPELRDDKTELFRELEQELLQEEATSERARRMLTKYLERLDEISDLVVVGACTEGVFYAGTSNVLHIVGRTRSAPYVYYHRTFKGRQFDDGVFTPWRKVPIEIEAKSVAPVIVNGGLRLFWPVVTLKDKIAKDADNQGPMQTKAEVRLMWASLIPALGEWAKPRLGSSKVFDYHPVTIFSRDDKDDAPDDSYYHFRTGVEGEGTVKVEIYKTEFPSGGTLKPTVIGVIRVNAAGEDFAQQQNLLMNVGNNHPNGSYLLRNAAIETGSTVEGNAAGTSFTMRGSGAFFQTHMPPFRALVTNFGYLDQAQNEPFFVETPMVSLFALHRGTSRSVGLSADLNQEAHFITFNNPQMPELKSRFTANGPPGIMNRLTEALPMSDGRYYYNYSNSYISANRGAYQSGYNNRYNGYYGGVYLGYHIAGDRMAWGISQRDFEAEFQPGSKSVERPYPLPTIEFGYGTPFGVYNWELFFHLPLLVADRLTQEMRFEEAMDWYHYVFDPRLDLNSYEKSRRFPYKLPGGARYWNFLPFFANKDATDSLLDVFGVKQSLSVYEKEDLKAIVSEWRHNPFNPHLIARQRISAYQKSVVMKYLENLIAWGDQLFRQDSFESINQATQLYVLAAEILGKRPEVIEPLVQEPRYTYRELFAQGIDPFSNALVDVENLMVATSPYLDGRDVDASPPEADGPQNTALASLYFRIPRNEKLDGYWNTVFDRLFKIRNSMNIDGVKRTLALFQPPIDPALLVRAAALGIDLSTALSQLNQPLPYYRFNVWSAKAQDLANELKSFGSSLLGALEKKDAEQLALLRQSQEIRLLGLVKKVREDQLAEAEANIEALEASRALAQDRLDDYSNREFISAAETVSLVLTGVASHLELHAGIANTVGGVLGAIPQVEAGAFSATASFGGLHLASIFSAIASGLNATAGITRAASGLASTLGGYERRQEDWDLQIRQAELEIEQIEKQLAAAEIRRAIAEKELENHEVQIEQSQEVNDFLRGKFTNQELYQWMSTELMRSYRRAYNLAYDVAKTAERAFRFELGIEDASYIEAEYFDSRRQGLLAGDKLSYDVKRMDIAYLQKDRREFELTKSVSLASLDPIALQQLRSTGSCSFELPEVIFDLDHPGQYFRRIQAVRLSIPCVTGPYTSVSAKLSLLGSAVRKDNTSATTAEEYPYQGVDDPRFVHDIGGIQSIATSTSQDDAGLFELNFRDERYLPFEGAGAISRWRLELPDHARQFDYHTISDVVVTVSYTARDGGGTLKLGAANAIETALNRILELVSESPTGLARVFSMKREFPDGLHQLLSSGTTTMSILPQHFPFLLRDKGYTLTPRPEDNGVVTMRVIGKIGASASANVSFAFNQGTPSAAIPVDIAGTVGNVPRGSANVVDDWAPETWTFTQVDSGGAPILPENLTLTPNSVDDVIFELKYLVPEA